MMTHVDNARAEAAGSSGLTPVPTERLVDDPQLREQWRSLLANKWNPYGLYQTPEWFDHVVHTGRERLLPPLGWLQGAQLGALALPYRKNVTLPFEVRQYPLWQAQIHTIAFLGCEPLVPNDDRAWDNLLASALVSDPDADGVYLHSVPLDGFVWGYLHRSPWVAQHLSVYLPQKLRRFHALELPTSFEEYLATQFRKKKRYNLKRQVRLLEEQAHGSLEWRRVEGVEDARWFADAATRVAAHSWQMRWMLPGAYQSLTRPAWLEDLARRGLLRSYVLSCDGTPCAMVLGYQWGDFFHYSETSYDQGFARFSPGGVLLYLLISDLMEHNAPRWVSFGTGHSRYKEEYANRAWTDASVLLLRRNVRNALTSGSHKWFRGTIDWLKRWRPAGPTAAESN